MSLRQRARQRKQHRAPDNPAHRSAPHASQHIKAQLNCQT
jgi:hypothetical protein